MAGTVDRYKRLLLNLLPEGIAWEAKDATDSNLQKLAEGFGTELCRVDDRAEVLKREVDPNSTLEMLEDWESFLGLPDECTDADGQTLSDRRAQIIQKLTLRGGATQNAAFFEKIADTLGFTIVVNDLNPFLAGKSKAGDSLTNPPEWTYWFEVQADAIITFFLAGQGTAGQPLQVYGNETLECTIEKLKPAHTQVFFNFG